MPIEVRDETLLRKASSSVRLGATVSQKHANFIVTEGEEAKAADALALAEEVRERVKREHGIDLEYEVELWSSE